VFSLTAFAEEKKPAKKPLAKPAADKRAHSKPSPQQIRKFNELEKKEKQTGDGARTR
jgi:hypothetical protein